LIYFYAMLYFFLVDKLVYFFMTFHDSIYQLKIHYDKCVIDKLVEEYIKSGNKLYSPIYKKVCNNYMSWLFSLTYNIDKEGCNYFFYRLETPHYSKHSGILLGEESFSYSETYKGWTGWKKYTPEELKTRMWMKHRNYNITMETKDRISNTLLNYNASDAGIIDRHKKAKQMILYWKTDDGIKDKRSRMAKQSISMKALIADGKFTPPITNTWTHWNAHVQVGESVYRFRSSWEACFWLCNQHCVYETIRVKTNKRTFVNDFFDPINNICYEIKPRSRYNIEIEKMTALQNYCAENKIRFIWINENNMIKYIDETKFIGNINISQLEKAKKSWKH
jgi:hypothetical protein